MIIRALKDSEYSRAQALVEQVFAASVAPGYSPQGRASFAEFLDYAFCVGRMFGALDFYGAFIGRRLIGVSVHKDGHLYLLFVLDGWRNKGVGRALLYDCAARCGSFTVKAAPQAHGFYLACGLTDAGPLAEEDGIKYIPMIYRADNAQQ